LFVLAIAILSVRPFVYLSVHHTGGSVKNGAQARVTKSSPSAAWKTLVSGTVKPFHKFEGVTPNEGTKWEGHRENLRYSADKALAER